MDQIRKAFVVCAVAFFAPQQWYGVKAVVTLRQSRICRGGWCTYSIRDVLGALSVCMSAPAERRIGEIDARDGVTRCGPMIILGSKSSTRRVIVEEMGFIPIVRSADIDERAIGDRTRDPSDLVLRLGVAKAEALLPVLRAEAERGELEGATMLLTGDQVVVHEERILEKPADEAEIRRNIASYARTPCRTVGSAVLTEVATGKQVSGVDTAEISFAEVPEGVVDELCHEGKLLQCAGGLMIEHPLIQPYVTNIEGTMDSVMGLSKPLVRRLLRDIMDL